MKKICTVTNMNWDFEKCAMYGNGFGVFVHMGLSANILNKFLFLVSVFCK